jgi:hypothetical protein
MLAEVTDEAHLGRSCFVNSFRDLIVHGWASELGVYHWHGRLACGSLAGLVDVSFGCGKAGRRVTLEALRCETGKIDHVAGLDGFEESRQDR